MRSIPIIARKDKPITINGITINNRLTEVCNWGKFVVVDVAMGLSTKRSAPQSSGRWRILELIIAPITIPTINIDQTILTNLERLFSSEISNNRAVNGVELALKAKPYPAKINANKPAHK